MSNFISLISHPSSELLTRLQLNMVPKNDVPAYVLGVGLTKFIKPRQTRAYPEMGYEAGVKAMLDAQINYDDVETGVACYCYGDTTSGQRVFYQFGMSS
jgi:sterol carrier protein 2